MMFEIYFLISLLLYNDIFPKLFSVIVVQESLFLTMCSLPGDTIAPDTLHAMVLSYPRYCRMRCLLKRLGSIGAEAEMRSTLVQALGKSLLKHMNHIYNT